MDKIKFKKIKNFLSVEEIKLLAIYSEKLHRNYTTNPKADFNNSRTIDLGIYADPVFESLLLTKLPIIEKETNLKVFPTYSYWRMYTWGSQLKKHIDRPSCEISATVHISGKSNNFPLYIDGNEIHTKPGDAIIYKGIELEHWRNILDQDFQSQVFLHYVNQNGPYKDFKFDKRNKI